jgi:hypothetical protein
MFFTREKLKGPKGKELLMKLKQLMKENPADWEDLVFLGFAWRLHRYPKKVRKVLLLSAEAQAELLDKIVET